MKMSVGMKIGAGFAFAIIILIVLGCVTFVSINSLVNTNKEGTAVREGVVQIERVITLIRDGQRKQRGFVITGEDAMLEGYDGAKSELLKTLQSIATRFAADPNEKTNEKTIEGIPGPLKTLFGVWDDNIKTRRDSGLAAAAAKVSTLQAKTEFDGLDADLIQVRDDELKHLADNEKNAASSGATTKGIILFGVPISIIFLIGAAVLISLNISRPLRSLVETTEAVASGDLTKDPSVRSRKDEIGTLAQSFQRMTESLREQTRQIVEGSSVISSTTSEILATTTELASSAAQGATSVSQTAASIEEAKQTAELSNSKSKAVAESAQQATENSKSGEAAVEETVTGMNSIREQMASIADSIVRLSEQSQAIGDVVSSVDDIAEQSNLLAVNASIEATKAGEQGKGFTVVAQEIKNLAEQSKRATAQVRNMLGEIQKATSAAVMATELGSKVVESGVERAASTGEVIRMMAGTIGENEQAAMQMAASSQQLLVGLDQISAAIEDIKQSSVQNQAGADQLEQAARNLDDLGKNLNQLIQHYKV